MSESTAKPRKFRKGRYIVAPIYQCDAATYSPDYEDGPSWTPEELRKEVDRFYARGDSSMKLLNGHLEHDKHGTGEPIGGIQEMWVDGDDRLMVMAYINPYLTAGRRWIDCLESGKARVGVSHETPAEKYRDAQGRWHWKKHAIRSVVLTDSPDQKVYVENFGTARHDVLKTSLVDAVKTLDTWDRSYNPAHATRLKPHVRDHLIREFKDEAQQHTPPPSTDRVKSTETSATSRDVAGDTTPMATDPTDTSASPTQDKTNDSPRHLSGSTATPEMSHTGSSQPTTTQTPPATNHNQGDQAQAHQHQQSSSTSGNNNQPGSSSPPHQRGPDTMDTTPAQSTPNGGNDNTSNHQANASHGNNVPTTSNGNAPNGGGGSHAAPWYPQPQQSQPSPQQQQQQQQPQYPQQQQHQQSQPQAPPQQHPQYPQQQQAPPQQSQPQYPQQNQPQAPPQYPQWPMFNPMMPYGNNGGWPGYQQPQQTSQQQQQPPASAWSMPNPWMSQPPFQPPAQTPTPPQQPQSTQQPPQNASSNASESSSEQDVRNALQVIQRNMALANQLSTPEGRHSFGEQKQKEIERSVVDDFNSVKEGFYQTLINNGWTPEKAKSAITSIETSEDDGARQAVVTMAHANAPSSHSFQESIYRNSHKRANPYADQNQRPAKSHIPSNPAWNQRVGSKENTPAPPQPQQEPKKTLRLQRTLGLNSQRINDKAYMRYLGAENWMEAMQSNPYLSSFAPEQRRALDQASQNPDVLRIVSHLENSTPTRNNLWSDTGVIDM